MPDSPRSPERGSARTRRVGDPVRRRGIGDRPQRQTEVETAKRQLDKGPPASAAPAGRGKPACPAAESTCRGRGDSKAPGGRRHPEERSAEFAAESRIGARSQRRQGEGKAGSRHVDGRQRFRSQPESGSKAQYEPPRRKTKSCSTAGGYGAPGQAIMAKFHHTPPERPRARRPLRRMLNRPSGTQMFSPSSTSPIFGDSPCRAFSSEGGRTWHWD